MEICHRPQVAASAPGKIIIFGEHFVVYNNEAIVAAINRRCYGSARFTEGLELEMDADTGINHNPNTGQHATEMDAHAVKELIKPLNIFCQYILKGHVPGIGLQIHIKSEIPVGVGLGSSAASCVMLAGILRSIIAGTGSKELSSYDKKWVFEKAQRGEQMIHNKSSGVDCFVSTYGGLVRYAGLTGTTSIKNLPLPFFLINTRRSHETSELVSRVDRFRMNRSKYFNELARLASTICSDGLRAIEKGSLEEIGQLMTENHRLLKVIGVSTMEIEKVIGICIRCGSLGTKITGAGGGGCVLVLTRPERVRAINSALEELNLSLEAIDIEHKGLVIN